MAQVVLKSGLFGDRTIKVNISTKIGVPSRTATGTGRAVTLIKQASGEVTVRYDHGKNNITSQTYDRKTALQEAAKFIVKYEPAVR